MRKLLVYITAAVVMAAAAIPAAASADTPSEPGPPHASAQSDVGLRATAIEYGLIAGLLLQEPGADPVVDPWVLEPDDDPAFDPGFGGAPDVDPRLDVAAPGASAYPAAGAELELGDDGALIV